MADAPGGNKYPVGLQWAVSKRGIPFIVSLILHTLAWIIAAATEPAIECGPRRIARVDYDDVNNGSFFFGMCIVGFIIELIFVGLYLFVGLDALTNIKVNTADNAVCMLNWWSVELSTHAFQTFLVGLASILFAVGISQYQNDVNDIVGGNCEINQAGFIVAVVLILPFGLVALGFLLRQSFLDFKESGGFPIGGGAPRPQQEAAAANYAGDPGKI
eukprot:m.298949 g.298949  ORF g.298949 m.298949 type:complete len:216 (+) comp16412_c2_seq14:138-785(+)